MKKRIRVRAARCGHHYDEECRSCVSANEWNDNEICQLQHELREMGWLLVAFGLVIGILLLTLVLTIWWAW